MCGMARPDILEQDVGVSPRDRTTIGHGCLLLVRISLRRICGADRYTPARLHFALSFSLRFGLEAAISDDIDTFDFVPPGGLRTVQGMDLDLAPWSFFWRNSPMLRGADGSGERGDAPLFKRRLVKRA